jgi:N-acetylmuramoyl-L-alanine amidase
LLTLYENVPGNYTEPASIPGANQGMQTSIKQRIGHYFQRHRVMSIIVGHVVVMTVLTVGLFGNGIGQSLVSVLAQAACPAGDQAHMVMFGETLSGIAMTNNITWSALAQHNNIANPNLIYPGQTICLPSGSSGGQTGHAPAAPAPSYGPTGSDNPFPYGQCTYWADERYHALHGAYVPWMTNSNAWQWTMRADEYHWNVSSTPSIGAIINLQPWVQGAGGYGHVAIVEKILANGQVMASNMNWGGSAGVTDVDFTPGAGVTFVTH